MRYGLALAIIFLADIAYADEPIHFAKDRPADVQHIRLDVKVDLRSKTLGGRAAVDLVPLRDVRSIQFDAVDFNVKGVQLSLGGSAPFPCDFENDGQHITVKLPKGAGKAGQKIQVIVDYDVTDPAGGLSFYAPGDEDPEAPYLMWSQGESITNRYWVPCFDHPNEKQTTEIACTVEKPNIAISNGRLVEKKDNEDGTRTFHWLQDQPHVSYLMTLVVGEFYSKTVQWRGRPVTYHVREKFKDKIDNSFKNTPAMLDYFSDQIGVEYPWAKYDQVCCYNFGGGMENTSATTLTESTLHDDRAHLDEDSEGLVAHELAHQWWGDLLTCKDWAHLWLNEGFASYFEALWDEKHLGREEFAYNMDRKARGAISGGKDKPIVYRNYKDPDEQFDSRAYPKGAWVLHMMRRRLGDELFWKVIKTYCTKFAHQSVETSDLRKTAEEVTGREFERFFHDWTERPGAPEVELKYEWEEENKSAVVRVKQKQKADAFEFPLRLVFSQLDKEAEPVVFERALKEKDARFIIPMELRPQLVQVDPEQAVLMELELDLPRDLWAAMLMSDANPAARIRAAEHFGKSKSKPDAKLLCERLTAEKFWAVQSEIAAALGKIGGEEPKKALLAGISIQNPKARRAVIEALGKFPDDEEVRQAVRQIAEKGDASYQVEAAAIRAYGEIGEATDPEFFDSLLKRDSEDEVIRRAALQAMGKRSGAAAIDLLIPWAKPGKIPQCRSAAADAIAEILKEHGEEMDADARKRAVDAISCCLKKGGSRRLQIGAINALAKIGRDAKGALEQIERLRATGGPRVRAAAAEAVKKIREAAPAQTAVKDLREDLEELREENEELRDRIEMLEAEREGRRDTGK